MSHAEFRIFPSVVETAPPSLDVPAGSLIEHLVITDRGQQALVGEYALSEGRSPGRIVNASPEQRDYRLLLKAALLLASQEKPGAISLGLGFPTATLNSYTERLDTLLSNLETVEFDARPIGGTGTVAQPVQVVNTAVSSEIGACDTGLREGPVRATGSHFIISLGYGTCEAALATPSGIVQRTTVSLPGMRYAVERAMQEVSRTANLGLRTEHQFDTHFRSGRITVGRDRISLTDIRKRALEAYMQNVIAPALANAWTSEDFDRADQLYVTGGGALYPVIGDLIRAEFGGTLSTHVVPDPLSLAALGYALQAAKGAPAGATAVGVDIGNANTCVCILEQ